MDLEISTAVEFCDLSILFKMMEVALHGGLQIVILFMRLYYMWYGDLLNGCQLKSGK